ncbi:PLP-dependent aminotransferase family protein [Clostridium sp.]|uniref:aminotransferase-like domain-containing protein n=1 Tax=Clostridium sp. TaxID=1506 RepID=UPI002636DF4B|nr:PLP-dependent aminotransferase family protein [Clostridium sp.]
MTKYEAIINYIKDEIMNGSIKQGKKLPSIRTISEKFNCSKVTATKAYALLEKEHIAYSIPKSGYYAIVRNLIKEEKLVSEKIDFFTSTPDSSVVPYEDFQHCINQAMSYYKENLFHNSDTQGLKDLLTVVAKQLQNYQVFTNEENIFITSGSQQAINILTMMEFPNGNRNVLVEQPTYHGVIKSLELNNVKILGIDRSENGINFHELERIFRNENIKFFYTIPRFHNPTGYSYTNKEKQRILKLCEKYDVYIVEDDYLGDLDVDKRSYPIYSLDASARVIYLKTYSKILLPGLRIAATVIPSKLISKFREHKKWTDINTSMLSQGALQIYIKSGMFDRHIKEIKNLYHLRMNFLYDLVKNQNYPNDKYYIPKGGFFASFEINNNKSVRDIIKSLYTKNILIGDSSRYYLNNNINNKFIRISISKLNNNEIEKGISIILNEISS